jgi:hypothetical protein
MGDAARIRALEMQVESLKRRLDQRPVIQYSTGTPYMFVLIDGGNTLDNGDLGVIYVDSVIASVSSAYDPNATSTFEDGIGRGTLYINGSAQVGYVLVVNDQRGVNRNAVIAGESPYTGSSVQIPAGGGASITAYVIC